MDQGPKIEEFKCIFSLQKLVYKDEGREKRMREEKRGK